MILPILQSNSEDEEGNNGYHSVRGNSNRDGYGNSGGQHSAADFWDDFNINDPQSVYADKYSEQEEVNNYRNNHQYKRPAAVESSWGQRQVRE